MQVGLLIDPSLDGASQLSFETVKILNKHFPKASLWAAIMSITGVKFITPVSNLTDYCSKLERVLSKKESVSEPGEWKAIENRLLSTWRSKEPNCVFQFVHIHSEGDFMNLPSMHDYFLKSWPLIENKSDAFGHFLLNKGSYLNFDLPVEEMEGKPVLEVVEKQIPISWITLPKFLNFSNYFLTDENFLYLLCREGRISVFSEDYNKLLLSNYFKAKTPLERSTLPSHLQNCSYESILIYSKDPFISALRDAIYNNSEHCNSLLETFKAYFSTYSEDLFNGDNELYLTLWEELKILDFVDYDPFPVPRLEVNPQMNPSYLKLQCSSTDADCNLSIKRKSAYSPLYSLNKTTLK